MPVSLRPEFSVELELSAGNWTDVTPDVLQRVPVRAVRGIPNSSPLDQVARPGRMSFSLNNGAGNSAGLAGYYSPGHDNRRAGFNHGTRVRLKITSTQVPAVDDDVPALFGDHLFGDVLFGGATSVVSRYVFRGRLITISPTPGVYGSAETECVAADYMQDLANFTDMQLTLAEGDAADDLVTSVVALMQDAPANTNYDAGTDAYSFAFDDLGGRISAMTAMAKICRSEGGFLFVRGDSTDGETLTFQNRTARSNAISLISVTEDDMATPGGIEVPASLERIVNDVEVRVFPRRVDTGNVSLVQLDSEIEVGAGVTLDPIFVDYRDVANSEAVFVGGKSMVQPVANTDFTANASSGGGGADVTGDFTVAATYFGSSVMLVITNAGGSTGFLRGVGTDGMKCRGLGLYRYAPLTVRGTNADSIAEFGNRPLVRPMDMYYQSSQAVGQANADLVALNYAGLSNTPTRVQLRTENPTLLQATLPRDIGDRINTTETQTAVNVDTIINGVEYEISDGTVKTWWVLAPIGETGELTFVFDDASRGKLNTGGVLGHG